MTPQARPGSHDQARRAAAAVVEEFLREHPELSSGTVDEWTYQIVLAGEVRHVIPVTIHVGPRSCAVSSFLLRGPRGGSARLHRLLLRKNLHLARARLCLDADDDVVILARMPLEAVSVAELDQVLGEILIVGETGFEALVHVAYPGVFPPLK